MSHECINQKEVDAAKALDEQCRGRLAAGATEKDLRDRGLDLLRERIGGRIERGEVLNGE